MRDQEVFSQQQNEKRQRGLSFQDEIRESWALVPHCWRIRIPDGGSRPADELILLNEVRILAEHKRTESARFELSFLRPNQLTGLKAFLKTSPNNFGLVFISFLNTEMDRDETYCFSLKHAIRAMVEVKTQCIPLECFQSPSWMGHRFKLKLEKTARIDTAICNNPDKLRGKRYYDLSGVEKWCKSL